MDAVSPKDRKSDQPEAQQQLSPPFDGDAVYVLATDTGYLEKNGGESVKRSFSTTDGVDIYRTRSPELNPVLASIHSLSGVVVNDVRFSRLVIILIIANAIIMGIGTFDFVTENPSVSRSFDVADDVFLILFTIELGLQLVHRGWTLFSDAWLTFDFVVVLLSWAFSGMQVIRSFRIIRAVRLVTRVPELKNLVNALLNVVPRLGAIGLLLGLVFYVFAVMFTGLFKDLYRDGHTSDDYFSRLDKTCFTLFQLMTLESWTTVVKEVMAVYAWAWFPFITFIMVSAFIVINLIIAVICDAVAQLQVDEIGKRIQGIESMGDEMNTTRGDVLRLESKIDDLASTVNWLLRQQQMQIEQQSSMTSPPQRPDNKDDIEVS